MLRSVDEVVAFLGGDAAVSRLTGVSPQVVQNWKARRRLPSKTYLFLLQELSARRAAAPAKLWGMWEADR